jgi:undecaprenyl-diphosphatase
MEMVKRFDTAVSKWILSWSAGWQSPLAGISFFGEPWVILAIAAGGLISAAARGQDIIMWAFIWSGVAYGVNTLIKQLTRRHRPHNRRVSMLGIRSYSFPSGHAFGAVIFYGLYAYLDYTYLEAPLNIIIILALSFLSLMIGVSRVRLGTHYPSDVIGGWLLGGAALSIIVWRLF